MFSKQSVELKKEMFSSLTYDYLTHKESLNSFYSFFPNKVGYKNAIDSISNYKFDRGLLVSEIKKDAALVQNNSDSSIKNIELLANPKTYTITTGHQLCLFTGPSYFIYKIISVISLCEKLKQEFPENNFVPVYWMASEDHDFEEVNHFFVYGKPLRWETNQTGAVGSFSTEGLKELFSQFTDLIGTSEHALYLVDLFKKTYLEHSDLARATRFLVNELFGKYGLVIVDGNNKNLKTTFIKQFEKDIFENTPYKLVSESIQMLEKLNYSSQVNPRPINCFYMDKGIRGRIEKEKDKFKVVGTDIVFSEAEIKNLINSHPEKISPNVVLRPLYQQTILPNLTYVGGPGEIAYWLEYKAMFDELGLFFPVLTPRKFITIMEKNVVNKLEKLGFEKETAFENEQEMIKIYLEKNNKSFDLDAYKKNIENLFRKISEDMANIDKTLVASTDAEKQKSVKSLEILEQKAVRAIKQKSETEISQIKNIKSKLFPDGIPQDRIENFSTFYTKWGNNFLDALKENLTYDLKKNDLEIIFEV